MPENSSTAAPTGAEANKGNTQAEGVVKPPAASGQLTFEGIVTKPEGEGTGANGGESKDKQPPAAGDLTLKAPEGVDPEALGVFTEQAKALGFNSEQAQGMLDFLTKKATDGAEAAKKAEADAAAQQSQRWQEELKADKEFGGQNYEANILLAKKALIWADGGDFLKLMTELGLENLPALNKVWAKVGKGLKEDSANAGDKAPAADNSQQARLRKQYPSMYNVDGSPK